MPWTLYLIPPMDSGWMLFEHAEQARSTTLLREVCGGDDEYYAFELSVFDEVLETSKSKAQEMGWRGDISVEPKVFWLPGDCAPCYGFAWKAEDNGSTYVASPIELSHLTKVAIEEAEFTPTADFPGHLEGLT